MANAALGEALASETNFHVINVILDHAGFKKERERLLTKTRLYGSRLALFHLKNLRELPFPRYFANTVVVQTSLDRFPAKELQRVLRPCGGILFSPGKGKGDLAGVVVSGLRSNRAGPTKHRVYLVSNQLKVRWIRSYRRGDVDIVVRRVDIPLPHKRR